MIENLRLRLHRHCAVKGERVKSAGEAILHVLLHIYAIGGGCAVVFRMAGTAAIAARGCRVGRMAVGRCNARAGGHGLSNLGRRNCIPLVWLTVVGGILHLVRHCNGQGVTCLVGHGDR